MAIARERQRSRAMPLVLQGTLVWAAGTAWGLLADGLTPWLLAFVLVAIGAWLGTARDDAATLERPVALALLAGSAVLLGQDIARADARCAHALRSGALRELTLRAPAAPGSFVRAVARDPALGCRQELAVAVRSGSAAAGARVRWTGGELTDGNRGLLLRDAHLQPLAPPGPLDRWRNRVAARLDRHFGPDGPMVRALLIADTRGLDHGIRERYADAGLVHMLSISGLHVAIVGGALLLLVGAFRLPRRLGVSVAIAVIALYVLAIGAPPPALRSATLFAVTQGARLWQRLVSPWGSFALGALVPLLDPRTVLDLGWQLSVSGYAAIIVAGRVGRRLGPHWRGWTRGLATDFTAGALSTLATAPLVAWHFGRLSLIAPVSNLLAGPIIALLQPTLFLTMVLPDALGAAWAVDAARPLLRALDAVAATAAALPGAAVVVAPGWPSLLLALVSVTCVLVAGWSPRRRTAIAIGATAALVLAWLPADATLARRTPVLELHLLDVGQGDALALRTPRGRWILVDAGRSWASGDAGRGTIIPYVRRRGGAVAHLILTHPHSDHIGGAASLLRALRPPVVHDPGFIAPSADYAALLRLADGLGLRWERVRPGRVLVVDGVQLEFVAPDSSWAAGLDDPNAASTVLRVRFGSIRLLLTGDAEREEEEWLLRHAHGGLRAEVLKVGHHGARTSSTEAFVDAVRPRIALVSVGGGNFYGHPAPEVMRRLSAAGATVLRTDQLGAVIVRTDGTTLEVEAAGLRWDTSVPLPETP